MANDLSRQLCELCGIEYEKIDNFIGKRFGRLIVIKRVNNKGNNQFYLCKCDCGKEKIIQKYSLIYGKTRSCGCLRKEISSRKNKTHNMTNSRLYRIYRHIKERCFNPNSKSYKYYGSCGIVMCNEWKNDFMNFYNWAMSNGYRNDLTIERIDVNDDYCSENCKWIPQKEQSKNRRNVHLITFNGKTQSLTDWSNELNINFNTLYQRIIISKWSIEKAFMSPIRRTQAINQRGRVGV